MGERHSIRAPGQRAIPRGALLLGLALVLSGAALPAHAGSQIYSYVDADGVTHFTNAPRGDGRFRPIVLRNLRPLRVAPARYEYDGLIDTAAATVRLPPALVKAVIAAESAFDSQAISRAGAQGLMQLMPTTAEHLGVADPFEPAQNVRGGATYLRSMLDRYGDLTRALAAYNAGPEAVDQYGGVPPYRETRDYVDRVLTYYRHYHGDFAR
jgi:soluble lytic murein transglycosylase-like protein